MKFDYVIEKIENAPLRSTPFAHIQIDELFDQDDFQQIVSAAEVRLAPQESDYRLFESLFDVGYEIINFPGSVLNKDRYIEWHKTRRADHGLNQSSCEGFGVTLRLTRPRSPAVYELLAFIGSTEFQAALARRFDIDASGLQFDAGLQKYLDGYEISPHPDVRRKALTFMVNINPSHESQFSQHHTQLLKFRPEYQYVQEYWRGRPAEERCWVPWDWCEAEKTHSQNNSLIAFMPSDETMHSVKAAYDHLGYQRTQLYGNFWYEIDRAGAGPIWEDLVIKPSSVRARRNFRGKVIEWLPKPVGDFVKRLVYRSAPVNVDRLK